MLFLVLLAFAFTADPDGMFMQWFEDAKCTEKQGHVVVDWHEEEQCAMVGPAFNFLHKLNDTAFLLKEECNPQCTVCKYERTVLYKAGECTQHRHRYAIFQEGPFTFGANYYGLLTWEQKAQEKCGGESVFRLIFGDKFCEENRRDKTSTETFCDDQGVFNIYHYTSEDCSGDPVSKHTAKTDYCYEGGWHDTFQTKIYCKAP